LARDAQQPPKIRSLRVLSRLVARYRFHPWSTGAALLLLTVWAGLEMGIPVLVGEAVGMLEDFAGSGSGTLPAPFVQMMWLLAAAYGCKLALHWMADVTAGTVGQDCENDLRRDLFVHVLKLRFSYHDENRSGETIARSLRDMEKTRHFYREVALHYFEIVMLVLIGHGVAFWIGPIYGVIYDVIVGTALLLVVSAGRTIAKLDRACSDEYDEVTTVLQENVAGARVIRAFGREKGETSKFGGRLGAFSASWNRVNHFWTSTMPAFQNIYTLAIPSVLLACAWRVHTGVGGVEEAVAMLLLLRVVRHQLRPLTRLILLGQSAVASAARVFEVMDREEVILPSRDPKPLPPRGGHIKLVDVWFGHPGKPPILRGVNLEVPAGGSLGIIGATGSGKSSLVQLLPRFYDVGRGCILLDGVDVRDLDAAELRAEVGLVFQEPFLFSATVRENVRYGRPDVSDADVERCTQLAAAAEFVRGLPDGFDTIVGERGVSLSGGQRQRLTIARALARDPRVLVFDDATASVDAITEKKLFQGIRAAAAGRTTLVISQRVTSVRWCDRIAVLENGVVTAIGSHDELVEASPLYAEIWHHQKLDGGTIPEEVES
jgi:ATP-binding cassette subfamily B protein